MNKSRSILSLLLLGLITGMVFEQPARAVPIDCTIGFAGLGNVTSGATNTASFPNPVQVVYAGGDYSGSSSIFYSGHFQPDSFCWNWGHGNSDWTSHAAVDIDVKLNKLLVQPGQLELCRYLLLQWTVFLFLNGLRDC